MGDEFTNTYADYRRAESYAAAGHGGTYFLAFRDLPHILESHVSGRNALDFGCGAGRSSRFLRGLGYAVTGVDISAEMLARARASDRHGDYRLIEAGDLSGFEGGSFDLVLAMFPFDNIPTAAEKTGNLAGLGRLLAAGGRIVNVVSSPEIYCNEWLSFSSRGFPENRDARSGDTVRVVMLDVEDSRPVEDILWSHERYLEVYRAARLELIECYRPLGRHSDGYPWITEFSTPPWVIYVLGRSETGRAPTS